MSSPSLVPRSAPLALALLLAACSEDEGVLAGLDGPADIVLLPPGDFFEVPVAFATNFRSGRVSKLDLKRRNLLVEDGPAPWIGGPDIAFGAARAPSEITLVQSDGALTVWVADDSRDALLRAPYARLADAEGPGRLAFPRPRLRGDIEAFAADGSALADLSLSDLRLRDGRATTEVWTMTWDGRGFMVRGTASGLQRARALPSVPYESDRGEVLLTARVGGAEPEIGASLRFTVDSGVEEADAGGFVTDLLTTPDGDFVLAAVIPADGPGYVSIWDARAFIEAARIELPAGAVPERLSPSASDGTVWLADSSDVGDGGRIFRIDFVPGDADTFAATEVLVPEPAIDIADGTDPLAPRLFVAAAWSDAVWMLDPLTGTPVDVNPFTPEADPMRVGTLPTGLVATPGSGETALLDEDGSRIRRHGVFVATFAGDGYWLDAATGCQLPTTPAGARVDVAEGAESALFRDVDPPSDPILQRDPVSDRAVTMHSCGGIARTETWRFTFDEIDQSYEVEGSRSGVQAGRAREGVRYTTDRAELSVLIQPGRTPTTHGDAWAFPVNDGVDAFPLQQFPGDPVAYTDRYDDRDGPWWKLREREVVVVPHQGNDIVLWIDLAGLGQGVRDYQ